MTGDQRAFGQLVEPYRRELIAHAYRLVGSSADAEDVYQEAMLAAWRGRGTLRDPRALRSWLHTVTTRAGLRFVEKRGPRLPSWDEGGPHDPTKPLDPPADGPWVEPFQDPDPAHVVERWERLELAWIAALQTLPPLQRAAILLKDVLGYSSVEIAGMLETSPAAVNSALQRGRDTLSSTPSEESLQTVGTGSVKEADRQAAERFARAFAASDIDAIVELLNADVRFTMPPLPAWFKGIDDVRVFLELRVFATPWQMIPLGDVNGYPAYLGMQWQHDAFRPGAVIIIHTFNGTVRWIATFVEPALVEQWAARVQ
ncbi:RNA polymerase subunit sigma-70 [Salinibacterium sp. SYSU T00001]|uniref:RNA polymerase subunit sigma-70 n=1 Tax=Homoserinimonas sedimenticola TaxID=2986805 RepID=UPI002235EBFD|nr:RNA polymerase subunit sigma-70 [Salinibacterium sedimenticola]MCW4384607.1 RNA polymerase subunit sigma-70 [Salinibacterium sedimenticola]